MNLDEAKLIFDNVKQTYVQNYYACEQMGQVFILNAKTNRTLSVEQLAKELDKLNLRMHPLSTFKFMSIIEKGRIVRKQKDFTYKKPKDVKRVLDKIFNLPEYR